jgi:MFS family permease
MEHKNTTILIGLLFVGVLMGALDLLNLFFSVGRLLGAATVGGVAASHGGGTLGYQVAFVVMGIPAAAMVFLATRLKSKAAEQNAAGTDLATQSA